MGKTASLANIGTIADSSLGFRNRIINGAMVIDQRNAGASVALDNSSKYPVDRFVVRTATGTGNTGIRSLTAPAGFVNSLLVTVGTGASPATGALNYIFQAIEGLNIFDLAWGTASASSISLSFKVRSSLTGTFSGAVCNGSLNRSYPFTFVINSANTFEDKTVTIAGDTSGTWATDNSAGLYLFIDLGIGDTYRGTAGAWAGADYRAATGANKLVATSGATFYITGVQLEKGSTATSFDYRPYGTELALCQRYYYKETANAGSPLGQNAFAISATSARIMGKFAVTLRTRPTALEQTGTAANYFVYTGGTTRVCSAVPLFNDATTETWFVSATVASGQTAGHGGSAGSDAANVYLAWSAEL